ncbi:unnamed protein product [Callosobruchus maculatus]|uniref:Uncharacterized protein n=1 Tax=Callosobruchus maculatus TaxID=64391 RepID=A0A653DQ73_CALMS|nr:unnamed protein product [Callosobruchus maculatus]
MQLIFPRSSSAKTSLCLSSCLLTCARHFSRPRCSRYLAYMERKMAPALSTSQPTPSPNRASPVSPEKSSPSNATNAIVIQHTSTRL